MMKNAVESKPSDSKSNPCKIMATIKASSVPTVVTYTMTVISFESFKALILIFRVFMASIKAAISTSAMHPDRNITQE